MDLKNMKHWQADFHVSTFDAGAGSLLRVSRLLLWVQETTELHMEQFQMGYADLRKNGIVFLTARTWMKIHRMPRFGETVTVHTRPCGVKGAQFFRAYEVWCGEELCVELVQTSVAADPETHRIHMPRVFDAYGYDVDSGGKPPMVPPKLKTESLPLLGERDIRYSDLDYNDHVSNALYADFVLDIVPGGMNGKTLREMQINYIGEAKEGDTLQLFGTLDETGRLDLYGEHSRGRSFDAYAVFA